ncbi:hypothetical protein SGRIM128S_06106 [Streptomyces griseomycini]
MTFSPRLWEPRVAVLSSSVTSKSRWSSLPLATSRAASAGSTRVWPPALRIWTGMCSRPSARSSPTTRPLASTTTRSPVISVMRWSALSEDVFADGCPVAAVRSPSAAAGLVMPAARATAAAVATVAAHALFTCLRKVPPSGVAG